MIKKDSNKIYKLIESIDSQLNQIEYKINLSQQKTHSAKQLIKHFVLKIKQILTQTNQEINKAD